MLYLYARVSTDKQEHGREAQVSRLERWADGAECRLFVDEDVSAFSVPLFRRPKGKEMCDLLRQGDTVVITKLDRAFRRTLDYALTKESWAKLGIDLVIIDMPANLNTPQGRMYLSMMVAYGEFESEMHGQRKREVYAHRRATGQPYNQTRPFGWVATKNKMGRLEGWAPCQAEQELGRRVLAMRESGMSWCRIATTLACSGVRKPRRRRDSSGYYHVQDVLLLARAATAGYPRLPQGFWRVPGYEQKLDAMKSDAPLLSS